MQILDTNEQAVTTLGKLFGRLVTSPFEWDIKNQAVKGYYAVADEMSVRLKLDLLYTQGGIGEFSLQEGAITISAPNYDRLQNLYQQATVTYRQDNVHRR